MAIDKIPSVALDSGVPTRAQLPAGCVLQVVQTTNNTQVATASTSFVTTGISGVITPSATSSKVLVIVRIPFYTARYGAGFRVKRDAVAIYTPSQNYEMYCDPAGNANFRSIWSINLLDSPSTTSAITYAVDFAVLAGTSYVNEGGFYSSTVTLMEIAG
jgi:hypothetical protein